VQKLLPPPIPVKPNKQTLTGQAKDSRTRRGTSEAHPYLGARLERPPAERGRLVPEPGDAEEHVGAGAGHGLAHLLEEVGVVLLEPHPPAQQDVTKPQ
jgi:hypothetical protein